MSRAAWEQPLRLSTWSLVLPCKMVIYPCAGYYGGTPSINNEFPCGKWVQRQVNSDKFAFFSGCTDPLGMKNGTIHDSQLSASADGSNPSLARLDGLGCWLPQMDWDPWPWIRVDLHPLGTLVTGVIMQGCTSQGGWITKYQVEYTVDNATWQYVKDAAGDDMVRCD